MSEKSAALEQLNGVVQQVVDVFRGIPDPEMPVYALWNAKDILAHLTFWHESFARNVADLARGIPPRPLKGKLNHLNRAGVEEMRNLPVALILERLENAHALIRENALNPQIIEIPYTQGGRVYTPERHLTLVVDHMKKHLRDVRRAIRASHSL